MEKKLLLNDEHIQAGAKMMSFAGYSMPVQYTNVADEHNAVRNDCGIFDISHMGEFLFEGKDTELFLSKLTTFNYEKTKNNKAVYTLLINDNGGIIDDLILYKINSSKYFAIVNAANITKDFNRFQEHISKFETNLTNLSDNYCLYSIQGKNAVNMIYDYLNKDESFNKNITVKRFSFELNPTNKIYMLARTGYTGEDGFEIVVENRFAKEIWKQLITIGKKYNLKLCGLASRDTLRLEAGLMLYGNDLDDETTPAEANMMWVVKSDNFIGADKINRTNKKIIFFKMLERGIPRNKYKIYNNKNEEIGFVTSGTMTFTDKAGIGIGYVKPDYNNLDTELFIEIHNKKRKAIVVKSFK